MARSAVAWLVLALGGCGTRELLWTPPTEGTRAVAAVILEESAARWTSASTTEPLRGEEEGDALIGAENGQFLLLPASNEVLSVEGLAPLGLGGVAIDAGLDDVGQIWSISTAGVLARGRLELERRPPGIDWSTTSTQAPVGFELRAAALLHPFELFISFWENPDRGVDSVRGGLWSFQAGAFRELVSWTTASSSDLFVDVASADPQVVYAIGDPGGEVHRYQRPEGLVSRPRSSDHVRACPFRPWPTRGLRPPFRAPRSLGATQLPS